MSASFGTRPRRRLAALAAIVAVALTSASAEAGQPARLKPSPPIRPGVAAFPHLMAERGQASARINRSIAKADRAAVADVCKDFHRTVRVTMRGPRYLSLLANSDWSCGAYPARSQNALTFDLASGRPPDWKAILTPALVDKVIVPTDGDDAAARLIESPVLWKLYLNRARAMNKDCADVYADPGPLGTRMKVWPDAKANGLTLQASGWPHVVQACAVAIVVPLPALRALGVGAAFLKAVDEAHRRGWYEK